MRFSLTVLLPLVSLLASGTTLANQPPVVDSIATQNLPLGKSVIVAVNGHDPDGDPITYTATSSRSDVQVTVHTGNPYLKMTLKDYGDITFQLLRDVAPYTVDTIRGLANAGFYDFLTVHRGKPGFMIQGGSLDGHGHGGPGFEFEDEFHPYALFTGIGQLAMANGGSDSNGSQFFVTLGSPRWLDFNHTIFGQAVRGLDVAQQVAQQPRDADDILLTPVTITRVRETTNTADGVITINCSKTAAAATITVTGTDGKGGSHSVQFTAQPGSDSWYAPPILVNIGDLTTPVNTAAGIPFNVYDIDAKGGYWDLRPASMFEPFPVANAYVQGGKLWVVPETGYTGPIRALVVVGQNSYPYHEDTQEVMIGVGDKPVTVNAPVEITTLATYPLESVEVASFVDSDPAGTPAQYTASINWGDATVDAGMMTSSGGTMRVLGSHVYHSAGYYPVTVVATGNLGARAKVVSGVNVQRKLVNISNRGLGQGAAAAGAENFRFRTTGRVTVVNAGAFTLDDGSMNPITVRAPGHGRTNGQLVAATGLLSGTELVADTLETLQ